MQKRESPYFRFPDIEVGICVMCLCAIVLVDTFICLSFLNPRISQ